MLLAYRPETFASNTIYTCLEIWDAELQIDDIILFIEPNRLSKIAPDIPISPEQESRDFRTLKDLVAKKKTHTKFVVGPDTTRTPSGKDFLKRFVKQSKVLFYIPMSCVSTRVVAVVLIDTCMAQPYAGIKKIYSKYIYIPVVQYLC